MSPRSHPLQFGIRHLLGVMFVVALLSALIAPWVRGWSAGQWLSLGVQTGLELVIFALCLGIHMSLRTTQSGRLGEIFFRVPVRIEGSDIWNPVNAYVLIGSATIMLVLLTASSIMAEGKFEVTSLYCVFVGFFAAVGVTQLWHPPKEALVGERGVALVGRFISWDKLWFAYETCGGSGRVLLKTAGWAFEVFPDAEIERPLADFLQRQARPWYFPPRRSEHERR